MEKVLSFFFFLLLSLLPFKNITYAQQEIETCFTFIEVGAYKKAVEIGKLAIKKYPKNSNVYGCLGYAYYALGEFKPAYENLTKAESLAKNKEELMYIYNIMGKIEHSLGNLDDALLYYNRSLSLAKTLGNTDYQVDILNNMGKIYRSKKEWDKAFSYYGKALGLEIKKKYPFITILLIYVAKEMIFKRLLKRLF
jgi:tetratricopeptide (TPR) repeat protein